MTHPDIHADQTYVCGKCAHQWCAPEHPDRCENCRAHGSWLTGYADPDDADDASETFCEQLTLGALAPLAPAIPGQQSLAGDAGPDAPLRCPVDGATLAGDAIMARAGRVRECPDCGTVYNHAGAVGA